MKITLNEDLFIEQMLKYNRRHLSKYALHLIWDELEAIEQDSDDESSDVCLVEIATTYSELPVNEFMDQYDFWKFSNVTHDSHISLRKDAIRAYLESKDTFVAIYDSMVVFKDF